MNKLPITTRIVSPSSSGSILSAETVENSVKNLWNLNVVCTYSDSYVHDQISTSELILAKANDINNAYEDASVDLIMTSIGGYNSNRILDYLNWDVIKSNPKPICGYSDITVLLNAIHAITNQITFLGPHFSTLGMKRGLEYTLRHFELSLLRGAGYEVIPSSEWSDDRWYINQEDRTFIKNSGPVIINDGIAVGKIIGGNLCSLNLLQGTKYMPDINGAMLFLEDDCLPGNFTLHEFERNLHSLLSQADSAGVSGLIIGRFQMESNVAIQDLKDLLNSYEALRNCPVICNMDFGHTTPMLTLPIGGVCRVSAFNDGIKVNVEASNNSIQRKA